jgi:hypothetical protein
VRALCHVDVASADGESSRRTLLDSCEGFVLVERQAEYVTSEKFRSVAKCVGSRKRAAPSANVGLRRLRKVFVDEAAEHIVTLDAERRGSGDGRFTP